MKNKDLLEQLLYVGSATATQQSSQSSIGGNTKMPSGKRYIGQSGEDFPIIDDEEYITHKDYTEMGGKMKNSAVEWLAMLEQDVDPDEPEGEKEETPAEGGEEAAATPDVAGGMMMDPNQFTSSQIGRIYELKKIYSRLMTLETFLMDETSQEILKLRKYISKAIDLFQILISNIHLFKDKLDQIIINFYKFLNEIFSEVRTYYKNQALKNKNEVTKNE